MRAHLIGARELRELLARHQARPKKSLGQHFVIDPNTIRKIIDVAAVSKTDSVLEVGAGPGSLTAGLAHAAGRVIAVEIDDGLIAALRETIAGADNVEIIHADALELELDAIHANKVVANLPYNIATHVVLKILEEAPQIGELTVMTQREVGQRLAASPGSKTYGQTSVMVGFLATARVAARVSRRAFFPVPDVDSVIVRIQRRRGLDDVERRLLFAVVRAAFSQRRKTLRNALAPLAGSVQSSEAALAGAGVDPGARAEELDVDAFVAITRALRESSRA